MRCMLLPLRDLQFFGHMHTFDVGTAGVVAQYWSPCHAHHHGRHSIAVHRPALSINSPSVASSNEYFEMLLCHLFERLIWYCYVEVSLGIRNICDIILYV